MFLRFFRLTGAQVLFVILILSIGLWLPSFLHAPGTLFFFDKASMPLYKLFTNMMTVDSMVGRILTFLLILLQAFLLVRMNTRFIFINNRTYLPALFYILLTASVPALQRLNPVIFSGFFLILALDQIFDSYKVNRLAYEFFTASIFMGIATLFYPYMLYFSFILWVSLATLKPFRWREWMFTILGYLVPFYFAFSYFYVFFNQPKRLWDDFSSVLLNNFPSVHYSIPIIVFACFILFLMALASQYMMKTYGSKKILPRKAFAIFLWLFILSVVIYLLNKNVSAEILYIAAIPVSFLMAHYFALIKSEFWGNIFLLTILILLVVIHIF